MRFLNRVIAVKVGDNTTGLSYQQGTGSDIPWLQTDLKISIHPSGGHPGEIQCGGTIAADVFDFSENIAEDTGVNTHHATLAKRKCGGNNSAIQRVAG